MLAGAVLYLLEWVAIIGAHVGVPLGATASAHDVAASYLAHADALGWAAGWFGVVELGRVLLMVGLRSALAQFSAARRLMDAAVAAMAVSVALEVLVYSMASGASWSLGHGGSLGTVRVLDAAAFQINRTMYGPLGISLLCAGVAMWRSGVFARALPALAVVAGAGCTVIGLALVAPRYAGAADALSSVALLMWIWMVWTGIIVWRGRAVPERRAGTARSAQNLHVPYADPDQPRS